jgi:hypothetical protein
VRRPVGDDVEQVASRAAEFERAHDGVRIAPPLPSALRGGGRARPAVPGRPRHRMRVFVVGTRLCSPVLCQRSARRALVVGSSSADWHCVTRAIRPCDWAADQWRTPGRCGAAGSACGPSDGSPSGSPTHIQQRKAHLALREAASMPVPGPASRGGSSAGRPSRPPSRATPLPRCSRSARPRDDARGRVPARSRRVALPRRGSQHRRGRGPTARDRRTVVHRAFLVPHSSPSR